MKLNPCAISNQQTACNFLQIPIGGRFEFRGRRYEKLAATFAGDEDRCGHHFHPETEVISSMQFAHRSASSKGSASGLLQAPADWTAPRGMPSELPRCRSVG